MGAATAMTTEKEIDSAFRSNPDYSGVKAIRYHESELKSAIQKYVRRSEVNKAVVAGLQLFRQTAPLHTAFINRVPIICIEDIGWEKIAETVEYCEKIKKLTEFSEEKELKKKDRSEFLIKLGTDGRKKLAEQLAIRVTEMLANEPKNKSACWVVDIGIPRHRELYVDWRQRLEAAVDSNDPVNAAGIANSGFKFEGEKYQPLFDEFERLSRLRGKFAEKTIKALRWRLAKGGARGCDVGIMIGGAVMALCRSPKVPLALMEPDYDFVNLKEVYDNPKSIKDKDLLIDWYCFDLHGFVGKFCLEIAAKKLLKEEKYKDGGGPSTYEVEKRAWKLGHLMFMEEGAMIAPWSKGEYEFHDEAYKVIYQREYGTSVEDGHKEWEKVKDRMKNLIIWGLKKFNKQ